MEVHSKGKKIGRCFEVESRNIVKLELVLDLLRSVRYRD